MQSHKPESRLEEGSYTLYLNLPKDHIFLSSPKKTPVDICIPNPSLLLNLAPNNASKQKVWAVASWVLLSGSLEQLLEMGRSGMEVLVKIPEEKERTGEKAPRNCMFGSASLIVINKAMPKPLIQSSELWNCGNGPWHGLPCANSSDVVHSSVVSEELMERKCWDGEREESQQRTCQVVLGGSWPVWGMWV